MEIIISELRAYPITFNFEELKIEIKNKLESYKGIVYDEEQIKLAKADKAKLSAFRTSLENKRKEIKNQQAVPYLEFEAQIKELVALVDEPLNEIDAQVKKFEEVKKEEKRAKIERLYEDAIEKIGTNLIPLSKVWNERWLNVTYKIEDIKKELLELAARFETDLQVIEAKEEFKDALIFKFFECLNLGEVLQYELKLQEEKKRRESQEQPKPAALQQPQTIQRKVIEYPHGNNNNVEILTLRFSVNEAQKKALRDCIRENKIPAEVIKSI